MRRNLVVHSSVGGRLGRVGCSRSLRKDGDMDKGRVVEEEVKLGLSNRIPESVCSIAFKNSLMDGCVPVWY